MSKPLLLSCSRFLLVCSFFCVMPTPVFTQQVAPNVSAEKGDTSLHSGHLMPGEASVSSETISRLSGPFACDSDGNIYLRSGLGSAPILKLNPKGERVALFQPAVNPDLEVGIAGSFSVAPDGELYMLVHARKEISRYVFIFKPDGGYKEKIKLQPGFGWIPYSLAVFPDGSMLISGERYDRDPRDPKLPFTGIFSADGRLLKELKLDDNNAVVAKTSSVPASGAVPITSAGSQAIAWGQIESAQDGNLYVMRSSSPAIFYGISPGGAVERRFAVDSGHAGYRPQGMHISGNRIAVLFYDPHTMDKTMKIVDVEGQELAVYDEPRADRKADLGTIGLAFACYTQKPERFIFLVTDDKHRIQLKPVQGR